VKHLPDKLIVKKIVNDLIVKEIVNVLILSPVTILLTKQCLTAVHNSIYRFKLTELLNSNT
jgi:hypothetical protein